MPSDNLPWEFPGRDIIRGIEKSFSRKMTFPVEVRFLGYMVKPLICVGGFINYPVLRDFHFFNNQVIRVTGMFNNRLGALPYYGNVNFCSSRKIPGTPRHPARVVSDCIYTFSG